jgi:hypothetical protein
MEVSLKGYTSSSVAVVKVESINASEVSTEFDSVNPTC